MFGFWSIEFLDACGWVLQYVLKSKNSRPHSFIVGRRRSRKNQERPAKAEGYWLSDGQPPHGSLSLSLSHSARHCVLLYKGQNVTGWRAYKEKVLHSLWPLGRQMIESTMSVETVLMVMMTWHDMIQHEGDTPLWTLILKFHLQILLSVRPGNPMVLLWNLFVECLLAKGHIS